MARRFWNSFFDVGVTPPVESKDEAGSVISTGTSMPSANGEAAFADGHGSTFILGWLNDPVAATSMSLGSEPLIFGRTMRHDVVAALSIEPDKETGYWAIGNRADFNGELGEVRVEFSDGTFSKILHPVRSTTTSDLLRKTLDWTQYADFTKEKMRGVIDALDSGLGSFILTLFQDVLAEEGELVQRVDFGPAMEAPAASFVTCIHGDASWIGVQQASFSSDPKIADCEFLYVVNSPQDEILALRNARIASRAYGTRISVLLMKGNVGFSYGCNIGALNALSERLIFINPDVIQPVGAHWISEHLKQISEYHTEEVGLVGVPLLYPDGALMHHGMYLEETQRGKHRSLRAVHYGKGFPATAATQVPLHVPAISGALMSVDANLFRDLKGFDTSFVFGHYEDADLCLRSQEAGVRPMLLPGSLFHVEGGGSSGLGFVKGATLVNQWHFSKRWNETRLSALTTISDDPAVSLGRYR